MTETRQADLSNRALASRILKTYLAPRWKGLSAAVVCTVIVAGLTGLLAQILDPAINQLIVRHTPGAIVIFPLAIVALAFGRGLAGVGQAVLVNRIGHGLVGDIQVELFGKLVRADLSRLRNTHTGAFVSSVLYGQQHPSEYGTVLRSHTDLTCTICKNRHSIRQNSCYCPFK